MNHEAINKIVEIQVSDVAAPRRKGNQAHHFTDVFKYLARKDNPQYGARPLKRLIQNKILTSVASLMISHGVTEGGEISVSLKNGEIAIDVKKKLTDRKRPKQAKKLTEVTS